MRKQQRGQPIRLHSGDSACRQGAKSSRTPLEILDRLASNGKTEKERPQATFPAGFEPSCHAIAGPKLGMCAYSEGTRFHPCRYLVYSKLTVAILSPLEIGTGCSGPSCLGLVVRRALEIGASRQAGNRAAKTQRWMQSRDRRVERRAGHPPEFRRTDFVFASRLFVVDECALLAPSLLSLRRSSLRSAA